MAAKQWWINVAYGRSGRCYNLRVRRSQLAQLMGIASLLTRVTARKFNFTLVSREPTPPGPGKGVVLAGGTGSRRLFPLTKITNNIYCRFTIVRKVGIISCS